MTKGKKFLKPKYLEARKTNQKLFIDFDGGYGYASCFLEEAFGGLKRELKDDNIFENLLIKSEEEPELIKQIESYMKES